MRSYRSEIEQLVPTLRQVARALVETHRPDVADDLVHEALEEALHGERAASLHEIEIRLFHRLITANRLRLRDAVGERRSQPGGGASRGASARPQGGLAGLDGLALADREALLLVVLGRLDHAAAGEVMGLSATALVSRLVHARDSLGAALWAAAAPTLPRLAGASHLRVVK